MFLYKFSCPDDEVEVESGQGIVPEHYDRCDIRYVIMSFQVSKCIGCACGSFLGGILADIFGRRKVVMVVSIIWALSSLILIFLPNLKMIQIGLVPHAAFGAIVNLVTYVNLVEIANRSNRFAVVYTQASYILGKLALAHANEKVIGWKPQRIFNASINAMALFAIWYMPESPRWLLNKNRKEDAFEQLKEISGLTYDAVLAGNTTKQSYCKILSHMFQHLLRRKLAHFLVFVLLMISATFSITCAEWYLLSNYELSGEFHLLIFTVEIVSCLFITPLYICAGKRFGLCLVFFFMTIQAFVGIFAFDKAESYSNIFAVLLGASAINLIWLYVMDIFPTFIRATALGCYYFVYSVSFFTAFMLGAHTDKSNKQAFYISFVIGGLLGMTVLTLPSTYKQDLPNFKLDV